MLCGFCCWQAIYDKWFVYEQHGERNDNKISVNLTWLYVYLITDDSIKLAIREGHIQDITIV